MRQFRKIRHELVVTGLSGTLFAFGFVMTGAMLACHRLLGGAHLEEPLARPSARPRETTSARVSSR